LQSTEQLRAESWGGEGVEGTKRAVEVESKRYVLVPGLDPEELTPRDDETKKTKTTIPTLQNCNKIAVTPSYDASHSNLPARRI